MQNLLFCVPKAAVLHGKSVGFAAQNSCFRNTKTKLSLIKRIIFTKTRWFSESSLNEKRNLYFTDIFLLN
ncbi:hypothetical protein [Prevotella intermedia]|uniref:hypothetical protein n=1 Tax=Prevotella intermedia TaxID=28131 RepID=UPI000957DB8A|nr:hypothetical protein [Prevotella intermedia]APW34481.1 hypothetical protein BWX40_06325 [Prevotella intermedia]